MHCCICSNFDYIQHLRNQGNRVVANDRRLLRLVIGIKISHVIIAGDSDWFITLSAPSVIGWINYFGIGLSTVVWKPLRSML